MQYLALQTGSEISTGAAVLADTEKVTVADGAFTLSKKPSTIGEICGLTDKIPVWLTKASESCGGGEGSEEIMVLLDATNLEHAEEITATETAGLGLENADYCARYFTKESGAKLAKIAANFFPAEMILVLTTNLFAGDANAPQNGKAAGKIVIKVPRYQLDGQFDMSMNMTSAATMSMSGSALAVNGGDGCSDEGYYAEIVEFIEGADFRDGLSMIAIDEDHNKVGDEVSVYALYNDGTHGRLDLDKVTFTPASAVVAGKWATAGSVTAKVEPKVAGGKEFTDTVTVTA